MCDNLEAEKNKKCEKIKDLLTPKDILRFPVHVSLENYEQTVERLNEITDKMETIHKLIEEIVPMVVSAKFGSSDKSNPLIQILPQDEQT